MSFNFMHVILALAVALPTIAGGVPASCNTGSLQCCNKIVKSDSAEGQALLGSISAAALNTKGLVGTQCSPIAAVGVAQGTSCTSNTVCCTNNSVNGAVSFGCSPATLGH